MFYLSYKIERQTLSEAAALIHHFTQDEFPPNAGAAHICFPVFGRTRRGHLAQIRSCIIQREPIFATRAPTSSDISSSLLEQNGKWGHWPENNQQNGN